MVWGLDAFGSTWVCNLQLGGMSGNSNMLGFLGAVVSPSGERIVAQAFNGALHLYSRRLSSDALDLHTDGVWEVIPCTSGHHGPVCDLSW